MYRRGSPLAVTAQRAEFLGFQIPSGSLRVSQAVSFCARVGQIHFTVPGHFLEISNGRIMESTMIKKQDPFQRLERTEMNSGALRTKSHFQAANDLR
jgi:hypothetical protein